MRFLSSRRSRIAAALLIAGVAALIIAAERYRRHDFTDYFVARRGRLAAADVTFRDGGDGWERFDVAVRNDRGVTTTAILQVPADWQGAPLPAFIILAGLETNKRAIEYVGETGDVVLLGLDYPYEGKRSHLGAFEFIARLPRMRRAILDTPSAVHLGVDLLLSRPEVDPSRIVLVGGSIGALLGPVSVAVEPRIAGGAFLFGAGNLEQLVAANISAPGPVAHAGAAVISLLTSPVEPTKYVGAISPRPVFMLSGTFDRRMPEACSRALHEAAREPRTIRWIEADHVHVRSSRFQALVRSELVEWLTETGFL